MNINRLPSIVEPFIAAGMTPTSAHWQRWIPIAAVLGAACCWGTQGIVYALLLDHVATDGLTVVTLRAATATVVLWVWLALTDRRALQLPRSGLPMFALLGLISVTLFYPALFYTYAWTSVAVGTTLLYLSPALVTLGAAMFLREPLTRRKIVALALTFVGAALVVQVYQPARLTGSASGIALGLVAAASYATYSVLGKRLLGEHRMATVLAGYLLLGSLGLVAVKLLISPFTWPSWGDSLTIGLTTGLTSTLAPIALYTFGLSRLPSSEASILLTIEPVVAFVLAGAILGQSLQPGQWLGAFAVLGGVLLLLRPAAHRAIGRRRAAIHLRLAEELD